MNNYNEIAAIFMSYTHNLQNAFDIKCNVTVNNLIECTVIITLLKYNAAVYHREFDIKFDEWYYISKKQKEEFARRQISLLINDCTGYYLYERN